MNEEEWLLALDTISLLHAARRLSGERKIRLFACACARQFFPVNVHPDLRSSVEIAEEMADGTATPTEVEREKELFDSLIYVGHYDARGFGGDNMSSARFVRDAINPRVLSVVRAVSCFLSDYDADMGLDYTQTGVPWLRDIFGNPFRSIDFTPWRTDTALSLARQMYDSRDFGAMPILADALQDAGCDNEVVLSHCREPNQVHFRGCWVVDGVLGLA
jgi:hypothetical protein